MTNHFFSFVQEEKKRLDEILSGRQDAPPSPRLQLQLPLTVLGALLGLGVSTLFLQSATPAQRLQDHPMCGITTGGQVR